MNNSGKPNIDDDTIVSLVQQHLVHDLSSVTATEASTGYQTDITTLSSPPTEAEIPIPYHLPGAAITHDIYNHANSLVMASQPLTRSKSVNDLSKQTTTTRKKSINDGEEGSSIESDQETVNEYENLDKPGGFRRFHVHQQHRLLATQQELNHNNNSRHPSAFQELFRPDSICSADTRQDYTTGLFNTNNKKHDISTTHTSYSHPYSYDITRHFLDFLAITSVMNQFAGEDLSNSETEDDADQLLVDTEEATEETALLSGVASRKKRHRPLQKSEHKKANVTKTIFLLFKAFIGSGILFLPKAFSNGGLLFSIIIMWLMGGISLYCFLLLLECKEHLSGSYGDMGGKLYGPWMRSMVLFSIAISQLGFMCGGTIFIVQNVVEAVRSLSGDTIHLNHTAVFVLLAILLMPLVLIRNIAKLSPTALLSDVLIISGLVTLLIYDMIEIFVDENSRIVSPRPGLNIEWLFNSTNYSVFIGTAVYSFEGIGLIIPIRDSMKKPEKFPSVLTFVMFLVAATLCSVGTLGYLAFGENVQTVALLNLPDGIVPNSIQLGYAVAVLLSNALTLFPTIRIIEHALFGERTGKHNLYIKWQKNTLRAGIVICGTLIALFGANDLDKFISLIGSICCCPLSLIFPPLFHMALRTTKGSRRVIDTVLIIFGIMVMLFTFYHTSKQWVSFG
ncbi:MAG: transmembrane amino acid transporter protein-domain-containing protein [Benjaminiella poitrasii]|nr:MAG: transmembrane amino acid transporter protein-domain-containing protein [Benjaminiella poitrasii]